MSLPTEIPIHHVSPFDDNDDDPFATRDEFSNSVFSPDDIREEIARDMSTAWAEEAGAQSPDFEEPDNSVSTLDIDGSAERTPSTPVSPADADSAEAWTPPSEFSQISLSGSDTHDVDDAVGYEQSDAPYPSVVIDASEAPSHRVILNLELDHANSGPHSQPPAEPSSTTSIPSLPLETTANSSEGQQISEAPSVTMASMAPLSITTNTHCTSAPSETPRKNGSTQSPITKHTGHRPARSTGPSMFEKVRSKTRPTFLPPKPKDEDEKHLADWERMMAHSRHTAEKQRKALQERRMARERHIDASIQTWEKEIVPDWRVVHKNPQLRKLWWHGIPTKLRASMWEKAVGNPLALGKDHFRSCLARAKRALASNLFPQATLDLIEQDIHCAFPQLHLFHPETGPMYADLKDMLHAWVVSRSDEGLGYTFGAAKIAAMFLIAMPSQQAFNVMKNLLERHCLRSFYGGDHSKDDVEAYYRIFDTLLADGMPKIYFNFKQHQISPAAYLQDWLLTLFLDHLPFEACARIWDVIILEGDAFLYRVALGILAVLEPRLFFPDRKELLELLGGENKAALDVAKREGQNLDGGKYEIYGVNEETLWERIDAMDDWWKESTWIRLIQRELPDI